MTVAPIVFLASGDAVATSPEATGPKSRGISQASPKPRVREVRLSAATRGAATTHRLEAVPGEDTVVLTLGNGQGLDLRLRLHPEHARDLLRAQAGQTVQRTREQAATALEPDAVQVPVSAQWQGVGGTSRGVMDLVFKALALVGLDPKDALAKLGAAALGKRLDDQVNEEVYKLNVHQLGKLKGAKPENVKASTEPTLVLIHGTFVDTESTFGKLWTSHGALVQQLFEHYGNRVYALDHGTVLRNPIANALTLARRLPQKARLHLVTHSRGGLVAEVLLRASRGVTQADLAQFAGKGYAQHLKDLLELEKLLTSRQVNVERIVRVACPAYGTLLASNRLDAYLSALAWLMERPGQGHPDDPA